MKIRRFRLMCFKMGNMLNLKLVRLFPICQLLKLFLNSANKAKQRVRVELSDCFGSGLKTKYKIDMKSLVHALAVRNPAYLRSQKSHFVTASLLITLYF